MNHILWRFFDLLTLILPSIHLRAICQRQAFNYYLEANRAIVHGYALHFENKYGEMRGGVSFTVGDGYEWRYVADMHKDMKNLYAPRNVEILERADD